MSADLSWQIIRNNSCFLRTVKNIDKKFSVEPFNLKGLNSRRYNGLVNKKTVDIQPSADGKSIVVATKTGHTQRPAKNIIKSKLKKRGGRVTLKSVKNITRQQNKAFVKLAARRASQLIRSLKRSAAKKTTTTTA